MIGRGRREPAGHIPFTPRAKKVLELSLREAEHLGHSYIGTEHLLLGLLVEGKGAAAQVLVKLGADLNAVRQQVLALLPGDQGQPMAAEGGEPGRREIGRLRQEVARLRSLLARHGIDADAAENDDG